MKKIFVTIFALFLILSSSTFAQFSIGPRFGINMSSISDDPDYGSGVEQSNHLGLMFGAAAELGIAGPIFIEAQLIYITKGEELAGQDQLGNQAEQILTANYLELPVLVKAKFPVGPVKPYAFVGPNIGIKLSGNSEFTAGGQTQDTDISDDLSSIDFALDFGAGIQVPIVPLISLSFDVRYSLGLSDIADPQQQQQQESTENTRGIQLMLGAMFGL